MNPSFPRRTRLLVQTLLLHIPAFAAGMLLAFATGTMFSPAGRPAAVPPCWKLWDTPYRQLAPLEQEARTQCDRLAVWQAEQP